MRIRAGLLITGWITLSVAKSLSAVIGAEPNESSGKLARLVQEMGDRDFTTRENATRELWMAGRSALGVLESAAEDRRNPERMLRALDLIRKIRFELSPQTDPEVVQWVEDYEKSRIVEKLRILAQMKKKGAFVPILRLYSEERDPKHAKRIGTELEGVAQRAARESLAIGDWEKAGTVLDLAPENPRSMVSRAVLLRLQGKLQTEWDEMDQNQRRSPWGLAVARVIGDLPQAREAAKAIESTELAAFLGVLEGDPRDWIEVMKRTSNPLELDYARLAIRRWNGEALADSDFTRLAEHADGKVGTSRFAATQMLFLLSRNDLAEPAFVDHSPLQAFQYFEQLERISEALEALGLDPKEPDYGEWFEKTMSQFRRIDFGNQNRFSAVDDELIEMASFLERRGLHQELMEAFTGPLLEYSREEQFDFLDFLSMLFGTAGQTNSAPEFARHVARQWVDDQPERWSDVLTNVLGESESVMEWWKRIGSLEPAFTGAQRFEVLLALMRVGSDPEELRSKWLERLVKQAGNDPELAELLHQMSVTSRDAALYGAVVDQVGHAKRADVFWGTRIYFLSALGRWEDVVEVLATYVADRKEAGAPYTSEIQIHAYLASALRLCGKDEEARKNDDIVELLYLGNPAFAVRIADAYAFSRDYQRAAEWWLRACVEGGSESSAFTKSMDSLATFWLENGEWLRASSVSECLLRLYANPNLQMGSPNAFAQLRLQADTARALSRYKSSPEKAIEALEASHRSYLSHGSLADVFFPSLRRVGLLEWHNKWFDETWKFMRGVIKEYPESDNTRNTAAWLAARAVRELAQGLRDVELALEYKPDQAAYLDTMAELQFALGKRKAAVEWSTKAMQSMPDDAVIRSQYFRFFSAPHPR